jgi:predicted 3-demethylubiquinone-9 3-methyltransferase (glyoxalase superfamily)
MPKITSFLWFDNQAEEAANFYVSIFPNSKIKVVNRYGEAGPGPKGYEEGRHRQDRSRRPRRIKGRG